MNKFTLNDFCGVIPAFLTPFDKNGMYDEKRAKPMIDWQISKGIGGLYLLGSTGYGPTLDISERMQALESQMKLIDGRVPVVAHIAAVSSRDTIKLAKHAQSLCCAAVSAVPSYFYKLKDAEIFDYYAAICDAVDIPLVAYAKTAEYTPSVELFQKLRTIPGVEGLKYTGPDHYMLGRIKEHLSADFRVYSGYDEMFLSGLMSGADAVIGSTYNVYPDLVIRAAKHLKSGDFAIAQKEYLLTNAIVEIFKKYGIMYAFRASLKKMGLDAGFNPPPFCAPFDEDCEKKFFEDLRRLKQHSEIKDFELFEAL